MSPKRLVQFATALIGVSGALCFSAGMPVLAEEGLPGEILIAAALPSRQVGTPASRLGKAKPAPSAKLGSELLRQRRIIEETRKKRLFDRIYFEDHLSLSPSFPEVDDTEVLLTALGLEFSNGEVSKYRGFQRFAFRKIRKQVRRLVSKDLDRHFSGDFNTDPNDRGNRKMELYSFQNERRIVKDRGWPYYIKSIAEKHPIQHLVVGERNVLVDAWGFQFDNEGRGRFKFRNILGAEYEPATAFGADAYQPRFMREFNDGPSWQPRTPWIDVEAGLAVKPRFNLRDDFVHRLFAWKAKVEFTVINPATGEESLEMEIEAEGDLDETKFALEFVLLKF